MSRNNCLNLLKCFACIGVVFIHIVFPGTLGDIIKYISAWAVPLFFMIAGYYSYGCSEEKIKRRLIKIIKILLFGVFWFLAYNVLSNLKNGTLSTWFVNYFNWKTPIYFFAFCTIQWATPLWYLIAMAETYFGWSFVVKFHFEDKATKFTWILFILGTVLTIVVESLALNWSFKINFLCQAVPWFMFGYLVKQNYEQKLDNINNLKLILAVVLGWTITLSAVLTKCIINFNSLGVLITAPALFLIGIKNSDIKVIEPVVYIGDKLSLFIYIFHPLVFSVVNYGLKIIGLSREGIYSYFQPIVTLICTIIVAAFFELIFRNKLLRKLIY